MVRWWWPGDDVDEVAIKREIAELAAAGFGGAEIQALTINLRPDMPAETRARVPLWQRQLLLTFVRPSTPPTRSGWCS